MPFDALALTEHLPEVSLEAGDVVVREGGTSSSIWILVSGALRVVKGDVTVNTIEHPGAVIGDMSLLLGNRHSATVEATQPTKLRFAANGNALLEGDPAFTKLVATGLAERLAYVTTYLADLTRQSDDAPGLSIVSSVLTEFEHRQAPPAQTGSLREPGQQS
jgi:CRP/FNR family transcriptional regulator, cyclic AMP receptor protein